MQNQAWERGAKMRNNRKQKFFKEYPELKEIIMVEKVICDSSGTYNKCALWKKLPKKIPYKRYCLLIDYLLIYGKIAMDKKGIIGWIWDPEGARYYLKHPELMAK